MAVVYGFSNRVELGSVFCRIGRPVNCRNIFGEQYIDQSVLGPTAVVPSLAITLTIRWITWLARDSDSIPNKYQ